MSSYPTRTHNPQLSATAALTQLLTLHPELPRIDWTVTADAAELAGRCWDAPADLVELIAETLGGKLGDPWLNKASGRTSQSVHAMFQDVPVLVTVHSAPAASLAVAS